MQMPFGKAPTRRVYDISDWILEYPDPYSITGRPGLRTLFRRLVLASLTAILAGCLCAPLRNLNDSLAWLLLAIAGVIVLLALLFSVSVLWQRIRITRQDNRFIVREFLSFPRLHSLPLSSLQGMNILEQEVRSSLKSGHRLLGWRWRVPIHADDDTFEFWCDHRPDQAMLSSTPPRVAKFAEQLQRITGLPCSDPQRITWRSDRQGAYRTGRSFVVAMEPECDRKNYKSLDEMPPELRRAAEGQIARMRAQGLTSLRHQQFTVTDSEGHVQTYQSLDEMPPEMRGRFEAARRHFQGRKE
jgi:hypothetical protein